MDNFNLMPLQPEPVNRIVTGQLPRELAELSEEALCQREGESSSASVLPAAWPGQLLSCSYDGDDAE